MKVQAQLMGLLVQVEPNKLAKASTEASRCSPDFQIFNCKTLWTKTVKYQDKVEHSKASITFSIQEQLELKSILTVSGFQVITLLATRVRRLQMAQLQASTTQCLQVECKERIQEWVALQFKEINTVVLVAYSWKTPFLREWRLASLLYRRAPTQAVQLIPICQITIISTTATKVGH